MVERVLQILQEGRRVSTYKLAVLLALLDLCQEGAAVGGRVLTTRQVAVKVVDVYWWGVKPYGEVRLSHNTGRPAVIVREVRAFQQAAGARRLYTPTQAALGDPDGYEALVRLVEWKLIEMPLPKLQRVGGTDTGWLFALSFDDGPRAARLGQVRRYQSGDSTAFDNRLVLRPEVHAAFVRLYGVLRPLVEGESCRAVAKLTGLPETRLADHLFGASRAGLRKLAPALRDLQGASCFYCRGRLTAQVHVDHFVPWARTRNDSLHNLVLAHRGCNGAKSDRLAALDHVDRWVGRNRSQAGALEQLAVELRWELGAARSHGAARTVYRGLPGDARLWLHGRETVAVDLVRVRELLG